MTREEAITVLKGLSENPLFSNQHKAAFNIAIHDIRAYHKWNLNELVLTQKDNEQEPILDKIRAEITDCLKALDEIEKSGLNIYLPNEMSGRRLTYQQCLEFIDKYKAETEYKQ